MLARHQRPATSPAAAAPSSHASSKMYYLNHASSSSSACSRQTMGRPTGVSVQANLFGGWFGGPQAPTSSSSKFVERLAYNKRETIQLGSLEVSPMGLGTWAWGNKLLWGYQPEMDAELQEAFNTVVAAGVNIFDTADSYGTGSLNGRSEQLLGQFIREYPGSAKVRSKLHVATKFAAYPWRVTPRNIVAACRGSLRRTGLQQISLGQLHWSAAKYAPLQEWALWNGLADCHEQGLIAEVGVSNYGAKELRRVARDFEKRGVQLASAQVQYSLLSAGPAQSSIKAVADDLGIVLIAYSPLALGLLTGKYSTDNLPKGPRGSLFKQLLPGIAPLTAALAAVADGRRKTVSQVAINWCICKGTVPIPGAKDLAQAKGNLGALGWRLSSGEVAELDAAAARCSSSMVQNIFQTS
ncbi:NADP-dependent oxidoreductase domain-containing protein [Scenedesmus sp. NREL 46B-D3]|nr:NADP-dependent oxidoreductase domain-containing protein [Scenedesmus sp. NREL 46B-D3]